MMAQRLPSEPEPVSMTIRPAVACGTKTLSRPSPAPVTNSAHSRVMSNRPRPWPVWTVIVSCFTIVSLAASN